MTIGLRDLAPCFEGVIPSIIATAAADGTPNISYLSHVVRVDDEHVALSNQFFAKTAANVRANPSVTLILVDCFTGDQYLLDVRFVRSVDAGPLFEKIALQLKASSAQVGMSEVMRLRSADIFKVDRIEMVPSPVETPPAASERPPVDLPRLAEAARSIQQQVDVEGVIDKLLEGVRDVLGYGYALVLTADGQRKCLTTVGSMGYAPSGLGSEAPEGEALIGSAATSGQTVKISDLSRVRRFGEAITADAETLENATRAIAFPRLAAAMSQIAVPMKVRGELIGMLFVESADRMAFREEDEAALGILADQAATALKAGETVAAPAEARPAPPPRETPATGDQIRVVHYGFDDSIFINDSYIVKGIAGALLRQTLEWHLKDGRREFSNRELRLALASRMPEFKDNLETRLLLLRRRLEEKQAPIRMHRIGRGRLCMETLGRPTLIAE